MFKKKFFVILYTMILAFLGVLTFYKIQERNLIIQLNNHNLSASAYRIKLKNNTNINDLDNQLSAAGKLDDIQVHYQDKKNKNITYFYGKGDFATPPMISGSFFSTDDFASDVTVAVVGKNVAKKLYKPQDQAYLKLHGNYIPVIGVMGDTKSSQLDNQIFIAESQLKTVKMSTSKYKIVIDAKEPMKKKEITESLAIKSITRLVSNKFIVPQSTWIVQHWTQMLCLIAIVFGLLGELLLWIASSKRNYLAARFLDMSSRKYAFEEWKSYSLYTGLGTLIGTLIGNLFLSLNSLVGALCYSIGTYLCMSILFFILVNKSINKVERNEKE